MNGSRLLGIAALVVLAAAGCASSAKKEAGAAAPAAGASQDGDAAIRSLSIGEFLIGPGDTLEIQVFRQDSLERTVTVDLSGKIMFPLIGDVPAAGTSVFGLRDEMTRRLSRYLVNPQVSIQVTEVRSRRVMVLGQVKSPGYFALETETSALEALAKAGGYEDAANLEKVLLVRNTGGRRSETLLNLRKALDGEDVASNVEMRSGDILYVPPTRLYSLARVASYLSNIISPIVGVESGIVMWPMVKDAFEGKSSSAVTVTP